MSHNLVSRSLFNHMREYVSKNFVLHLKEKCFYSYIHIKRHNSIHLISPEMIRMRKIKYKKIKCQFNGLVFVHTRHFY